MLHNNLVCDISNRIFVVFPICVSKMSGLRKRKNELRDSLYHVRDRMLQGIEEEHLNVETCQYGLDKLAAVFSQFQHVCEEMDEGFDEYKEIQKQGRIRKELSRVGDEYEDAVAAATEYIETRQRLEQELADRQEEEKARAASRDAPSSDKEMDTLRAAKERADTLVKELEATLTAARYQQQAVNTQLGVRACSSVEDEPTKAVEDNTEVYTTGGRRHATGGAGRVFHPEALYHIRVHYTIFC